MSSSATLEGASPPPHAQIQQRETAANGHRSPWSPPQHHPTRQGASPLPYSHPQIRQHETAANKPSTSCGIFSTSSPPMSSMALTRYTGAHTWERACQPPSSTVGRCTFVQSCACTVGFVTLAASWAVEGQGQRRQGRIWGLQCATRTLPHRVHCAIVCHCATAALYTLSLPSTCHHCPLHAATATLYTLPLPPSTRCHCHPLHAIPAARPFTH